MGSPVWNVRAPRIMPTFAERYDFAGKTIYPFTTCAMSWLGSAVDEYKAACRGAKLGQALAVRGEEAEGSGKAVDKWLRASDSSRPSKHGKRKAWPSSTSRNDNL